MHDSINSQAPGSQWLITSFAIKSHGESSFDFPMKYWALTASRSGPTFKGQMDEKKSLRIEETYWWASKGYSVLPCSCCTTSRIRSGRGFVLCSEAASLTETGCCEVNTRDAGFLTEIMDEPSWDLIKDEPRRLSRFSLRILPYRFEEFL